MGKTVRIITFGGMSLLLFLSSLAMIIVKPTLWPIVLAIFLVAISLSFVLFRQMKKPQIPAATTPDPSEEAAAAMVSLLNRQDKIVDQWKNTMETRDKLKILEISGNSESK